MKIPSTTTCLPRFSGGEHSDCHTGTIVASTPTPNPVIILPMKSCGSSNEVHDMASPTKVKTPPTKMVFRRHSTSPRKEQERDPKNAPSVNDEM